jgi:hypothetical protein
VIPYKEAFNYIELLKEVEKHGLGKEFNQFYEHRAEFKYSQVLIRLSHRIVLSQRSIPQQFDNCAGNFICSKKSRIIAIIGERPSKDSLLQRTYPFLDIDGSSGWLNSLLNTTNIREDQLFWINAKSINGDDNDPEIIHQLNPKAIVCLGKIAESWANKNGWEHLNVPHPQYWKRFKSTVEYPLIDLLRQISKS